MSQKPRESLLETLIKMNQALRPRSVLNVKPRLLLLGRGVNPVTNADTQHAGKLKGRHYDQIIIDDPFKKDK